MAESGIGQQLCRLQNMAAKIDPVIALLLSSERGITYRFTVLVARSLVSLV